MVRQCCEVVCFVFAWLINQTSVMTLRLREDASSDAIVHAVVVWCVLGSAYMEMACLPLPNCPSPTATVCRCTFTSFPQSTCMHCTTWVGLMRSVGLRKPARMLTLPRSVVLSRLIFRRLLHLNPLACIHLWSIHVEHLPYLPTRYG